MNLVRASLVLASQMEDSSFRKALPHHPSGVLTLLTNLADECDPGERLPVTESHCEQLRQLFKDFVKPEENNREGSPRRMVLDVARSFPPVRGAIFTEGQSCVHFLADPNPLESGLPRGTLMYANSPLPLKVSTAVSIGPEEHTTL